MYGAATNHASSGVFVEILCKRVFLSEVGRRVATCACEGAMTGQVHGRPAPLPVPAEVRREGRLPIEVLQRQQGALSLQAVATGG